MCNPINKEYLTYMDYMESKGDKDTDNMNDDIDDSCNDIDDNNNDENDDN